MPSVRPKDPEHWLYRHTPREWIQSALNELARAEVAFKQRSSGAGMAGLKRAAGMALNAALCVVPKEAWGRTYVEHVEALARDDSAPEAVREAARLLIQTRPSPVNLLSIGSKARDERLVEAARNIMAHAYAIVYGGAGRPRSAPPENDASGPVPEDDASPEEKP
jgi:HEPN domain-containing protein